MGALEDTDKNNGRLSYSLIPSTYFEQLFRMPVTAGWWRSKGG